MLCSGIAIPKKWEGVRTIFLCCLAVKSYNIHVHGTHLSINRKTSQRICANLRRGLNISGGSGPNPFPVATPLMLCMYVCIATHLQCGAVLDQVFGDEFGDFVFLDRGRTSRTFWQWEVTFHHRVQMRFMNDSISASARHVLVDLSCR